MRRPPDHLDHVPDPGSETNVISRILPSLAKRGADYEGRGETHRTWESTRRNIIHISSLLYFHLLQDISASSSTLITTAALYFSFFTLVKLLVQSSTPSLPLRITFRTELCFRIYNHASHPIAPPGKRHPDTSYALSLVETPLLGW